MADPRLATNQAGIVLPRWTGAAFASGSATIRQEFERLVGLYGAIAGASPAADAGRPRVSPADDILGRPRGAAPDLGAYEAGASGMAISPSSGPDSGGTGVAITGSGFQAGATVSIGGAAATGVSVGSAGFLTATMPARDPGTLHDVVVTNPDTSSSTLVEGWLSDFLDVPRADLFHSYVEAIFRAGITAGCLNGNYCRDDPSTRAQMAVFLLKAKFGQGHVPPPATGTVFDDVDPGDFAADWIEELASLGITGGCDPDNYCPDQAVTRGQMAVFLLKTLLGAAYVPPPAQQIFEDVPANYFAIAWVEDLYNRQITGGCLAVPLRYCPEDPNTRGQMAVFLLKTFLLP